MNRLELDQFNESIPFEEGKIYFRENYNYTSQLWESLKKQGWTMETCKSFIDIYDNEGNKVISTIGIIHALKELAILMS